MAARGASAAVQAEWAKSANEPAHLVEVRLDAADGGTVYLTDSWRAVSYAGNVYSGLGQMLGFDGLVEAVDMRVTDLSFRLSGVDQSWVSIVLSKQYIDRRLLIYQMFFDQTNEQLIVNPVVIHDGRMDEPTIEEDPASGKCVVTISSRDQFADFERLSGRHTNPNDQNLFFPNDRAFDMNAQLVGQRLQVLWGAAPRNGPDGPDNMIARFAGGIGGAIGNVLSRIGF